MSKGIMLLHDSDPVHITGVSKDAVRQCGFTELDHPPYSPEMDPPNNYLFTNFKQGLKRHFQLISRPRFFLYL